MAAGACCSAVRPNPSVWACDSDSHRQPALLECVARSAFPEQLNPLDPRAHVDERGGARGSVHGSRT